MSHTFDYTYDFSNIAEKLEKGLLQSIDHASGKTRFLNVAITDRALHMDAASETVPAHLADLADLALAVYIADRFSLHKKNKTLQLLVILPIRSAFLRDQESLQQELQDILYWYTEDHWSFQFVPYSHKGRFSEFAQRLPFPQEVEQRRVALWSGGLDALAGLYSQLRQEAEVQYTLIGTGANNMVFGKQRDTYKWLATLFPKRLKLIQIPLRLKKQDTKTNSSARARGFVFLLLGAISACLEKQHTLYIHENGIGALNLPFRDCEVGLDQSRSVHPLSLQYMSTFLSHILNEPFSFENPFLFATKAEISENVLQNAPALAFATMSCDSWHRQETMQCGYCTSCLLRRQAILSLGIQDGTDYQITMGREKRDGDEAELVAMLAQVETFRDVLKQPNPWIALSDIYPILDDVVQTQLQNDQTKKESIQQQILHLYQEYVHEWDRTDKTLKVGLLF